MTTVTDTIAARPLHPLRIRDFRLYLLARLCATFGQNSMMIIVGWQAYSIARMEMGIHASAARLGLIGLAQFLPLLVLTPVAGWLADRYDRRRIGGMSALVLVACAATLTLATIQQWVALPLIYAVAIFLGIARCFNGPAMSALTTRLVPRESLPQSIAFSSMAWQTAAIAGPAFGGVLYAIAPWASYALASVLFLASAICLQRIRPIENPPADRTRHPLRQMIDGLSYVRGNKLVLGAILLDLVAVLLAGATALLPVYARDILHVGSTGLGPLAAMTGFGAMLTAFWLGAHPIRNGVGTKMLIAVGLFGVATAIFGLTAFMPGSIAYTVALVSLFFCGVTDMISVYVRQSLIQLSTPDEMRGRVSSVSLLTISASNELGEVESGFAASLLGPVEAVVLGGVGAVVAAMFWPRIFPELSQIQRFTSDPAGVAALDSDPAKENVS